MVGQTRDGMVKARGRSIELDFCWEDARVAAQADSLLHDEDQTILISECDEL